MRNPLENDRYAIIPIPPGPPPDNAIMIGGPLSKIMENIPDTHARHDSIRAHQAARIDTMATEQKQKATRALQVAAFCDSIDTLARRLDSLAARRKECRAAKARKDAEEEARRVQEMLDALPDPDEDPNEPAFYPPSGHLHAASLTNTGDDNEGDLPQHLLQATPPPPGNYPVSNPVELSNLEKPKYQQPAAVSLNADEYGY
jgi:hypothetical protein